MGNRKLGSYAVQFVINEDSKSLEIPVFWHMLVAGEDEPDTARVFYVAAMRATQRLVIGVGGGGGFGNRLGS